MAYRVHIGTKLQQTICEIVCARQACLCPGERGRATVRAAVDATFLAVCVQTLVVT